MGEQKAEGSIARVPMPCAAYAAAVAAAAAAAAADPYRPSGSPAATRE